MIFPRLNSNSHQYWMGLRVVKLVFFRRDDKIASGRLRRPRRSFSPPDLQWACFATAHLGRNLRFARLSKKPRPDFVGTVLSVYPLRRTNVLHAPKQTKPAAITAGFLFVGTTRFELATPCTPCKCATGLRYVPKREFRGVQR